MDLKTRIFSNHIVKLIHLEVRLSKMDNKFPRERKHFSDKYSKEYFNFTIY